ncbi:MAG TPA: ferric reductase-like transmembrane domain-containing protein [Actinomycetota bacterium]|nr:ferric reductase-like transmembrane domain-containing protein [Actinomycetota bacterium]
MHGQLWWYVARSGGILAWALLAASVLWGLAMTTRVAGKVTRPAWLLDLHRFLGGAALLFTGIHVAAILLDTYVHFSLETVLVPLAGTWHPGAVAWGIVGLYLLVAIELTSLLRTRIPQRLWRQIHYVSFPLFVTTTVHALTAGTDRHSPLMVGSVVVVCAGVTFLTAVRLASVGKTDSAPPRVPLRQL